MLTGSPSTIMQDVDAGVLRESGQIQFRFDSMFNFSGGGVRFVDTTLLADAQDIVARAKRQRRRKVDIEIGRFKVRFGPGEPA